MKANIMDLLKQQRMVNMVLPVDVTFQDGSSIRAITLVEEIQGLVLGYVMRHDGNSWSRFHVWMYIRSISEIETAYWGLRAA